jgi:hypothetical protein
VFQPDPGSYWSLALDRLIGVSPMLVVAIVGLCFGLAALRRSRGAGGLVVVACALSIANGLGSPLGQAWLSHRMYTGGFIEDLRPWMIALSLATIVIHACAFGLLVIAALSWRTAGTPAVPARGADATLPHGPSTPISKGLFLGTIYGASITAWVAMVPMVVLMIEGDRDMVGVALALMGLVVVLVIVSTVMLMVLLYKLWASIQPTRTTAGKAVGFLFIPLFNLYWVFRAYRGWSVEANRFLLEHGIEAPRSSVGLATALCVLLVLSAVPYAGRPSGWSRRSWPSCTWAARSRSPTRSAGCEFPAAPLARRLDEPIRPRSASPKGAAPPARRQDQSLGPRHRNTTSTPTPMISHRSARLLT